MLIIEIIAVLFVMVLVHNLNGRVKELERKLEEKTLPPSPALTSAPASPMMTTPQIQSAAPAAAIPTGPTSEDVLISWLKDNWLLKLGALLLLMGFGWLVSYAFLNNWIGPSGRIALGLGAGSLILILGAWRMRAYVRQGSIFVALGAAVILLTTYAARSIYDFFTPTAALGLMFSTSALVALLSGIYNRKQLAIASIVLAGVAPILAHSPSADYVALFWYLLIIVFGSVWIVIWKDYREVVTTALVVVALYSMPILAGLESADMPILLLFAYGFAAIFYLTNTAGLLRLKGDSATADMVTAAGNALLLLAWIYLAAAPEWQSLIIAAWAAAFVIGAFVIFRASGERTPLVLYAAIGVAYLAAATAIELDGTALVIAYTLEAAAVALALFAMTKKVAIAQRASYLLIGPVALSLPSVLSSDWQIGVFNEHFFVLAILAVTFFGLGAMFFKAAHLSGSEDIMTGNAALLIMGSLYAYVLLWLSLHAALPANPDTAVMIALFVYTAIGIAAYLRGIASARKGLQVYGGMMLGFVVMRLLVVDVWQMELTGRIITFFLIGSLLMSTAFLSRTKKPTIHENITP